MLTKGCFLVELCKSLSEVKVIQKSCILANKRQREGVHKPALLLEGYSTVLRKWKRSSLREQKTAGQWTRSRPSAFRGLVLTALWEVTISSWNFPCCPAGGVATDWLRKYGKGLVCLPRKPGNSHRVQPLGLHVNSGMR